MRMLKTLMLAAGLSLALPALVPGAAHACPCDKDKVARDKTPSCDKAKDKTAKKPTKKNNKKPGSKG